MTAKDLGVDLAPRIKVISVEDPPVRQAGSIIPDVDTLVAKLKEGGHVWCNIVNIVNQINLYWDFMQCSAIVNLLNYTSIILFLVSLFVLYFKTDSRM